MEDLLQTLSQVVEPANTQPRYREGGKERREGRREERGDREGGREGEREGRREEGRRLELIVLKSYTRILTLYICTAPRQLPG